MCLQGPYNFSKLCDSNRVLDGRGHGRLWHHHLGHFWPSLTSLICLLVGELHGLFLEKMLLWGVWRSVLMAVEVVVLFVKISVELLETFILCSLSYSFGSCNNLPADNISKLFWLMITKAVLLWYFPIEMSSIWVCRFKIPLKNETLLDKLTRITTATFLPTSAERLLLYSQLWSIEGKCWFSNIAQNPPLFMWINVQFM